MWMTEGWDTTGLGWTRVCAEDAPLEARRPMFRHLVLTFPPMLNRVVMHGSLRLMVRMLEVVSPRPSHVTRHIVAHTAMRLLLASLCGDRGKDGAAVDIVAKMRHLLAVERVRSAHLVPPQGMQRFTIRMDPMPYSKTAAVSHDDEHCEYTPHTALGAVLMCVAGTRHPACDDILAMLIEHGALDAQADRDAAFVWYVSCSMQHTLPVPVLEHLKTHPVSSRHYWLCLRAYSVSCRIQPVCLPSCVEEVAVMPDDGDCTAMRVCATLEALARSRSPPVLVVPLIIQRGGHDLLNAAIRMSDGHAAFLICGGGGDADRYIDRDSMGWMQLSSLMTPAQRAAAWLAHGAAMLFATGDHISADDYKNMLTDVMSVYSRDCLFQTQLVVRIMCAAAHRHNADRQQAILDMFPAHMWSLRQATRVVSEYVLDGMTIPLHLKGLLSSAAARAHDDPALPRACHNKLRKQACQRIQHLGYGRRRRHLTAVIHAQLAVCFAQ